jgi:hypothetical protein
MKYSADLAINVHNVTPILMQLFDLYVEVTYLHFNSTV